MNSSEIILYTTPQGHIKVEVILQDETVWLTQKAMAELFGVAKSTISEHISNVYESGELQKESTVRNFRTVQKEGELIEDSVCAVFAHTLISKSTNSSIVNHQL